MEESGVLHLSAIHDQAGAVTPVNELALKSATVLSESPGFQEKANVPSNRSYELLHSAPLAPKGLPFTAKGGALVSRFRGYTGPRRGRGM